MRITFSGTPDQVVSAARKLTTPETVKEDSNRDDAFNQAIQTVAGERMIHAIKLYRTYYGCGLKDAKEAVERLIQW